MLIKAHRPQCNSAQMKHVLPWTSLHLSWFISWFEAPVHSILFVYFRNKAHRWVRGKSITHDCHVSDRKSTWPGSVSWGDCTSKCPFHPRCSPSPHQISHSTTIVPAFQICLLCCDMLPLKAHRDNNIWCEILLYSASRWSDLVRHMQMHTSLPLFSM